MISLVDLILAKKIHGGGGGEGKTYNDGYNDGHEAGYSEGHEQGKTDEWDAFWEQFQQGGAERNYNYAFTGAVWTDSNFKPKYKVLRSKNNSECMFADSAITDVTDIYLDFSKEGHRLNSLFSGSRIEKIGILDISGAYNSQELYQVSLFKNCRNLRSIEKLIIRSTGMHVNNSWFMGCTSLTDVTFEGGRSLARNGMDCKNCPFTLETAKSLINHLADMSGTSNEYVWTVSFSPTTWSYLDAEGDTASPNGSSWREYIQDLGWNV